MKTQKTNDPEYKIGHVYRVSWKDKDTTVENIVISICVGIHKTGMSLDDIYVVSGAEGMLLSGWEIAGDLEDTDVQDLGTKEQNPEYFL